MTSGNGGNGGTGWDDKKLAIMRRSRRVAKRRGNQLAKLVFGVPWGRMEPRKEREALCTVLLRSDDPRMEALGRDALLPDFARTSFATLCRKFEVSFTQVAKAYSAVKKAEGEMRVAQHLPDLMEQTALSAFDMIEDCADCEGTGTIAAIDKRTGGKVNKPCPKCKGKRTITVKGDGDRLKLIFETFISERRVPGPLVNLDLRNVGRRESLEDVSASVTDAIIDAPAQGGNE